jgi:hypothetical protein
MDIHDHMVNYNPCTTPCGDIKCDSLHKISVSIKERIQKEMDLVAGIDITAIPSKIIPSDSND